MTLPAFSILLTSSLSLSFGIGFPKVSVAHASINPSATFHFFICFLHVIFLDWFAAPERYNRYSTNNCDHTNNRRNWYRLALFLGRLDGANIENLFVRSVCE